MCIIKYIRRKRSEKYLNEIHHCAFCGEDIKKSDSHYIWCVPGDLYFCDEDCYRYYFSAHDR